VVVVVVGVASFVGCARHKTELIVKEKGKIRITELPMKYEYKDAVLRMVEPQGSILDTTGPVLFKFAVQNFELHAQTPDANDIGLANSGHGQHIHFIVNNKPYIAYYTDTFTYEFTEKGAYLVVAFLSRSYHISVKAPTAYVVKEIIVGRDVPSQYDLRSPMLIYSRPKGSYKGEETKKIALDFYLLNCDLSRDGFRVKAIIDGEEFILDKWTSYVIEGLEDGEHKIRLILIDQNGMPVGSPFSDSGERTIVLCSKGDC